MFLFLEPFQARVFSLTRFLLENRGEVRQKYSALVKRQVYCKEWSKKWVATMEKAVCAAELIERGGPVGHFSITIDALLRVDERVIRPELPELKMQCDTYGGYGN